jgi:ankyrin repeat protein
MRRTQKRAQAELVTATRQGSHDVVKSLLERGLARVNDVFRESSDSGDWDITVLHLAVERADLRMVGLLIDHGADTEMQGPRGLTPLAVASERSDVPMVKLLLERGAVPEPPNAPIHKTPLVLAVNSANVRVLDALVLGGARPGGEVLYLCIAKFASAENNSAFRNMALQLHFAGARMPADKQLTNLESMAFLRSLTDFRDKLSARKALQAEALQQYEDETRQISSGLYGWLKSVRRIG